MSMTPEQRATFVAAERAEFEQPKKAEPAAGYGRLLHIAVWLEAHGHKEPAQELRGIAEQIKQERKTNG